MKFISRVALFLIAAACAANAEVPAGWSTNLVLLSNNTSRPTLMFFTADWCAPCRLMARTTLTNAFVRHALEPFERVAVDIDAHPDLANQRNIEGVPTILILTPGGEEADRTVGYASAEDFAVWLT